VGFPPVAATVQSRSQLQFAAQRRVPMALFI